MKRNFADGKSAFRKSRQMYSHIFGSIVNKVDCGIKSACEIFILMFLKSESLMDKFKPDTL